MTTPRMWGNPERFHRPQLTIAEVAAIFQVPIHMLPTQEALDRLSERFDIY